VAVPRAETIERDWAAGYAFAGHRVNQYSRQYRSKYYQLNIFDVSENDFIYALD